MYLFIRTSDAYPDALHSLGAVFLHLRFLVVSVVSLRKPSAYKTAPLQLPTAPQCLRNCFSLFVVSLLSMLILLQPAGARDTAAESSEYEAIRTR